MYIYKRERERERERESYLLISCLSALNQHSVTNPHFAQDQNANNDKKQQHKGVLTLFQAYTEFPKGKIEKDNEIQTTHERRREVKMTGTHIFH